MKLGCIHDDAARIARCAPHVFGAAPIPPTLDRALPPVGLYRNDTLADCVVAALANSLRAQSMLVTGADRATTEDAVLAAFAGFANVPLDTVNAVPGLQPLDVIDAIQAGGFRAGGPAPETIRSCATVTTRDGLCDAAMRYGSAPIALDLYDGDMDGEWTGSPVGGLVGGHMVLARGWTFDGPILATWGGDRAASWQWVMTRIVCGYAVNWTIDVA